MSKKDIGILFDVSGSMKAPFTALNNNTSYKSEGLLYILEKMCCKAKNKIKLFVILFGGLKVPIYDFCNLLYLANQNFRYLYKDLVDIELKSKNDDSKELQILQIIEKYVSGIISEEITQKKIMVIVLRYWMQMI